ncbi:hypothetical protein EVA_17180 [gut metagenome]|uniref:Uncharacterized protein n=1 Tax=gut metagenome TaxID=749906 RepID=J9FIH9_9ZZZZ
MESFAELFLVFSFFLVAIVVGVDLKHTTLSAERVVDAQSHGLV